MTSRSERLADVTRLFCEWLNEHSKCSVIYCAIFWESPLNIIFLSDRVHTQPPPSILIFASTGSAFNKYLVCYLSQLSDDALPCDSQIIHSRRRSQSMSLKINSAWAAEICTIFFLRNENSNCATNYFYVVFHWDCLRKLIRFLLRAAICTTHAHHVTFIVLVDLEKFAWNFVRRFIFSRASLQYCASFRRLVGT